MEWILIFFLVKLCSVVFLYDAQALILEGTLQTKEDWIFLTRFCYRKNYGEIEFFFEYPEEYCCQELILYYDTQWPDVYPQDGKSCSAKRAVTKTENRQTLLLSNLVWNSGCLKVDDDNRKKVIRCSAHRKFSSIRARWWYLVISNCGTTIGLKLKYKLLLTNGNTFWRKHFSADEQNILQTDIFFGCALLIIFVISVYVAHVLISRQLFHTTYKIYLWVIVFELLSVIVNIGYYVDYGDSGKPKQSVKNVGRGLDCLSEIVLVFLLILLGKGWTVTRGRISPVGQVKLAVFCSFYAVAYVALFIYEAKAFDPGKVLYIYESPAGIGICILRVIAWLWFGYGVFFTLKNYREKRSFYYPFYMFYSIWFLSGPIVVMVALYVISPHVRAQVMNAVDRVVACMACGFFVLLTRPSAANKNFPFHVRTSQIGILNDNSTSESNNNFEQHAYSPSDAIELDNYKYTEMFAANKPPPPKDAERMSSVEELSYRNYNRSSLHVNANTQFGKAASPERHIQVYKSPIAKTNSNLVSISGEMFSQSFSGEHSQDMFSVTKNSIEQIIEKSDNDRAEKPDSPDSPGRGESKSEIRRETPTHLFQASNSSSLMNSRTSLQDDNTEDSKTSTSSNRSTTSLIHSTTTSESAMSTTASESPMQMFETATSSRSSVKPSALPSLTGNAGNLPPLRGGTNLPPLTKKTTLPPLKSNTGFNDEAVVKKESNA